MADLPEVSSWDAGIYQIEVVDPVEGGADGIDNRQAKALGNRTKWLRDHGLMDDTNAIGNYTAGQLFYAVGARLLAKLGIGASGRVLTSTGSAPQWSDTIVLTSVDAARFGSGRGVVSLPTGVATTIFTSGAATRGLYLFLIHLRDTGATQVKVARVFVDDPGAGPLIIDQNGGANVTFSVAGTNLQVTYTGGTNNFNWAFLFIPSGA